jgi:hypothetical protein
VTAFPLSSLDGTESEFLRLSEKSISRPPLVHVRTFSESTTEYLRELHYNGNRSLSCHLEICIYYNEISNIAQYQNEFLEEQRDLEYAKFRLRRLVSSTVHNLLSQLSNLSYVEEQKAN